MVVLTRTGTTHLDSDPPLPAGRAGSSLPTGSQEGELLRYGDDGDEGVFLGGVQSGSGRQHLLRRNGSDHRQRPQNLLCDYDQVGRLNSSGGTWVQLGANTKIFRPWNDETLSRAYDVLLEELDLPPSAPGGKVEFRRSLTLSFLFRFNLEVLQKFSEMVGDASDGLFFSS